MQGTSTFRRHKVKKQRTKNLLEGSIEAQRFDAMEKNVTVQTELHYTLDNGHAVKGYVPRKIFTNRGHPKYMAAGIDSIRRIIDNPAYQRYRQDGPEGLDQWLRSPEGIKHLEASGAFIDTRQFYKELDGRTLSKAELHEAGIEIYKAKYELLFDDYAQLKTLNKYMDEIITGRRPRTDREIRRIILDANRAGDNPTVDVPLEGTGKFMSTFAQMTRWGMTFNKWNREWVYDHMFNQVYKSQRKAGVGADDAIRIAASSARQRTGQVHFDLSYALKGELQHRYFAWFYTKHRLWSVWLGKAAIKYPGYAGAASELIDWLEKRSEDMNLPEWEKFHLQVGPIKVNFAPYLWLTPYPTESAMGMLGEAGLSAVSDRVFGDDLKSVNVNGQEINILAPKVFDYSFTRLDPLLINMWRAIQAPGGVKEGVAATVGLSAGSDFGTQEEWVEFIEKLPEGDRGAFVDAAVTYFVYHEDEGITIEEACAKVVAGNLRHELLRLMKPASTRIVTDTDEEMQRYMTEYGTLDTEKARQEYLRLHPNFARTIGAGRSEDPWTHMAVQEGWARYNDLSNRRSQEVKKAAANGNLLDPQYSQNIENGFRKDLDELFADIPAFAQAFNEGGMSPYTREQRLNLVFPAISIEGYENMRVPTPDEADIYAETVLTPQYKAACAAFGIPTNSTSLLNKRLKNKYIDTPKALYQKILPGDLAQTVKTNMRIIAMGGGTGARFRATQYMEAVINNDRRMFHLRGVKSGKADTLNLLMAVATPEEKYYYGFPVDEESERIWDAVTLEISQFQERMRSMDLRASATKYKDAKVDLMQHIQDTYYGRNEIFDVQYDYSVSDLVTRLELLGYPGYDTPESQGWADAIEIMHEFLYDLSQVENKISPTGYGVTSGAQSAADIQRKHLKRIVALSKENEDWLFQFKLMGFGLSRLGFYSEWKLGDKSDLDLWSLDTPIEEEEYSTQWGE